MPHEMPPVSEQPLDLTPPPVYESHGDSRYQFTIERAPDGYSVMGVPDDSSWAAVELGLMTAATPHGSHLRPDLEQGMREGKTRPVYIELSDLYSRNGKMPDMPALSQHLGLWIRDFVKRNGIHDVRGSATPGTSGAEMLSLAGLQPVRSDEDRAKANIPPVRKIAYKM